MSTHSKHWPPVVGVRYHVTLDDCCIEGSFEATCTEASPSLDDVAIDDDGWIDSWDCTIRFDNGVTLTRLGLVSLTPLDSNGAS